MNHGLGFSVSPALSQVNVLKVHKMFLVDNYHFSQDEVDATRDPGADHPPDGLQSYCPQLWDLWQEDAEGLPDPDQEVISPL